MTGYLGYTVLATLLQAIAGLPIARRAFTPVFRLRGIRPEL